MTVLTQVHHEKLVFSIKFSVFKCKCVYDVSHF